MTIEQQRADYDVWVESKKPNGFSAFDVWQAAIEHDRKQRGEPLYQVRYNKGEWQDSDKCRYEYLGDPSKGIDNWERRVIYATPQRGEVVVTKNMAGQIVAVTRQDEDGQILSVIAMTGGPQPAEAKEQDK